MKLRTLASLTLLTALFCGLAFVQAKDNPQNAQSEMAFAFIGDMPYKPAREPMFDRVIAEINADPSIQFVMHAGDIKSGSELCSDELIRRRFDQYQTFNVPFIHTPDDNEWTDCHHANNGRYDPLERLAFIRQVFFPNPDYSTGGRQVHVNSQIHMAGFEPFVENVWFKQNNVVFATIHVVGSENDLRLWDGIGETERSPAHNNEYETRNAANLAWLEEVFKVAEDANGIFLGMQVNPAFEDYDPRVPPVPNDPDANSPQGYRDFLDSLYAKALAHGKPVALSHGDDHVLRIDNPLDEEEPLKFDPPAMNLTRVQCYGNANIHWIKVYVDPKSPNVFKFEQHIVAANLTN